MKVANGQLWVSNTTPTELYFTTDAGDDIKITSGTSLASAAGTTINNNADNRIITGSGTADTLNGEADLTFDGSTFNIQSSSSGAPTLVIKNTTNDTNSGGMIFTKDKGDAGADGDDLGFILFKGDDSGQNQTDFAKIIGEVSESTDTDEAGKLSLQVAASDGTTTALVSGLVLEGEHNTGGEVDVTIGAGTIQQLLAGNLTVSGIGATSINAGHIGLSSGTFALTAFVGVITSPNIEFTSTNSNSPQLRLKILIMMLMVLDLSSPKIKELLVLLTTSMV